MALAGVRRALAGTVLFMAFAGCATEPPPSALNAQFHFVRHQNAMAQPLGLGTGLVQVRESCLYLNSGLLVWPADFRLAADVRLAADGPGVVIEGGGWAIRVGDTIEVGGGEYPSLETLPSRIIGNPPPCPGPYLWVGEVVAVQPGG